MHTYEQSRMFTYSYTHTGTKTYAYMYPNVLWLPTYLAKHFKPILADDRRLLLNYLVCHKRNLVVDYILL